LSPLDSNFIPRDINHSDVFQALRIENDIDTFVSKVVSREFETLNMLQEVALKQAVQVMRLDLCVFDFESLNVWL
jgi:rRNA-processing protein FCF1